MIAEIIEFLFINRKEINLKTAIIILNYNDYITTETYVNIIKSYQSIDKILVVDNNSSKNDYEKLIELSNEKIDIIKTDKNGGYAYGNNFGVRFLIEKYGKNYFDTYIISNPDIYVEDSAIKRCNSKLHSSKDIAQIAPRMYFVTGPARRSAWKKRTYLIDIACSTRLLELLLFFLLKKGEYNKEDFNKEYLDVYALAGSFFLIKSRIFEEIGMFDENTFLFFEEDILGDKISKRGMKVLSVNNEKFIHYDSQTIGKLMNLFKKQKIIFQSRKYYHKVYNNKNKLQLFIFDILYVFRCIELLFEVPIRKLFFKFKKSN